MGMNVCWSLTNGSMNGVLIVSANVLILLNPTNIVNVNVYLKWTVGIIVIGNCN